MPVGEEVAFLFTDIEGSTRLLAARGDEAYDDLLQRSRSLLRGAFAAHGGQEVGTEGDSFFVAFDAPADAVAAAVAGQAALAELEADGVRIRMGVHAGPALRRDGDFVGLSVHQAARIASAAHGGQVLVSRAIAAAAAGVELRPLGSHRLKDLERPEELFQVGAGDFPPPRSLELVTHNLPVQLSTFVGRAEELRTVGKLLDRARLVTVIGPGGAGKTRLALQAAADNVDSFPDGVWVAELAAVGEAGSLAATVLAAVGGREQRSEPPEATLVEQLRSRKALLLLDNCEHLVEAAARLAGLLLQSCPGLRILATSREQLRIEGEHTCPLQGLGLPEAPDLEAASWADAVRLFVARANEVRPSFELTAANAPHVVSVCARLDGMPLALELAASRVRSLSPAQLDERLGGSLDLLDAGTRGDPRRATLRGAIAWSHDLLSPLEKVLFRRLSVFAGGWPLEAAERVCAGSLLPAADIADTLTALADRSLVAVSEGPDDTVRYGLLEAIRAFARDQAVDAAETGEALGHHYAWCAELAAAGAAEADGPREAAAFDRLEAEHPNLLAALDFERAQGGEPVLAASLAPFWFARGHYRVAVARIAAALEVATGPLRVELLRRGALQAMRLGEYAGVTATLEEALALARSLGERSAEARVLETLAAERTDLGEYAEAKALIAEALAIAADLGDRRAEAALRAHLGNIGDRLGEVDAARADYERSVAFARETGYRSVEARSLGGLGYLHIREDDPAAAERRFTAALAIVRELRDRRNEATWLGALGNLAYRQERHDEGVRRFGQALAISRTLGDRGLIGGWAGNLGIIAALEERVGDARPLLLEALEASRSASDRVPEAIWLTGLGHIAVSEGDVVEARVHFAAALEILTETRVASSSWDLAGRVARLLSRQGDHAAALPLLGWFAAHEGVEASPERRAYDEICTNARAALDDAAVDGLLAEGETLGLDEVYARLRTALHA